MPEDITPGTKVLKLFVKEPHLIDVTDTRYGDIFPVPTEHQGVPLPDKTALCIVRTAIAYLEGILTEASAL